MKAQAFSFEVKDLMIQFVAAFDNVIIKRYNQNREPVSKLQVRYLYAPKQRVLYDIINKAQNITLPVISVSIASISRDTSRVFNKLAGFYFNRKTNENDSSLTTAFYGSPVPINIEVNMSVITKFQTDMDQILSNFVPYSDPYIIISWKVPDDADLAVGQEIRSEVLWSGNLNLQYPIETTATDKYRMVADTSFTIKGWLFKDLRNNTANNIFFVDNNFYTSSDISLLQFLSG
jgi:hypothetical protein